MAEMWAVKANDGEYIAWGTTEDDAKRDAHLSWVGSGPGESLKSWWQRMYDKGYRCVQVTVTEKEKE